MDFTDCWITFFKIITLNEILFSNIQDYIESVLFGI